MARRREFVPPVEAADGGWRINLDADERGLLVRLMGELATLLSGPDDDALLVRLFPTAFPHDEEKEREYQRLMREELVASRLAAITAVTGVLDGPPTRLLTEEETVAFLQAVNAVRLVLGTMLGITDDDSADEADDADTPEHHLYEFLGWLLEWTVRSLSPD
jgi:hypothetical protein